MNRLRARPTANLFAIAFGVAGLAGALDALPAANPIAEAVWVIALLVWAGLVAAYALHTRRGPSVMEDLRHPVLGPFAALVPLVALMLVTHFSRHTGSTVAVGLAALALTVSIAFAGWFTARWMLGGGELKQVHPGHLLPTVAASLVSAVCFSNLGLPGVAYALVGIGVMFWIVVTALFIARGLSGHADLGALTPTLAIHAAPAPVIGILWLSLGSPGGAAIGEVLLGLTVFGVATQLFLIPRYVRLAFAPTFWSFTFSSAAVASFLARWVTHEGLPAVLAVVPVVAVAVLIGSIGVRHLIDPLVRRRGAAPTSTARPRSAPAASRVPQ